MKLSDYIVKFIEDRDIEYVFGYIGGAITHIVDSLYSSNTVKFIQVYHEQTASIAAEGYSRNSSKIGIALATSGPGATNLITGIADAYFDSIPAIYITGQVNTYEYKFDKPIRQQGFQETDIVSIIKPVTKYAVMIKDPADIRYELEKAFFIAKNGRPGPVLLDIPMDVQRAEIDINNLKKFNGTDDKKNGNSYFDIKVVVEEILKSKRPIILAGGGINNAVAQDELYIFARKHRIPVVVSLMGKGSYPEDDGLFIGLIGSYGNRCANIALANSDLLLAIGTRLDTRQTGTSLDSFLREGKIIHVDIDKSELDFHRLKRYMNVSADAKTFLTELNDSLTDYPANDDWINYIHKLKIDYCQDKEVERNIDNKKPYDVIRIINEYSGKFNIFCTDIGQNQVITAQMLKLKKGQKYFTSGGMAPMGYSVPVAIGASFANNFKDKIIAITGDGGFHISLQALMLLSQYKLPIKVIVINNESLGMIVQFQNLYFGGRETGTTSNSGYKVPKIKDIASAYSLNYYYIDEKNFYDSDLLKGIFDNFDPCIVEFHVGKTDVAPKLMVNTPIEEISPDIEKEKLKDIMIIDLFIK